MTAQFLYNVKGYRSGAWSADATDFYVANTSSSFNSLNTLNTSGFYRTASGTWRRFYCDMNNGGHGSVSQYSSPNNRGVNTFNFKNNGELSLFDTEGWNNQELIWDNTRAPDAADLEIFASVVTAFGGSWIGTTGSWLSLSSNRDWSFRTGINTSGNGELSITIRHAPTLITLDGFSLNADVIYV